MSTPGTGGALLVGLVGIFIWLWMYRRQQRQRKGPKEWPFIAATIESLQNFNTMHDWILSYFQKGLKTFKVPMPDCTYTYTVDPANVEYILKTRFTNFPKVQTCKPNPIPGLCPWIVRSLSFEVTPTISSVPIYSGLMADSNHQNSNERNVHAELCLP